tara:strand:- start:53 stop:355 length:303 start_codon:yes stop_codon:yes gene_type:complete
MDITHLLALSIKEGASDLHLPAGLPPILRIDGDLVRMDLLAHANSDITTHYSAGELRELLEAVERLVKEDNRPTKAPEEQTKVLQFPYIVNDGNGRTKVK